MNPSQDRLPLTLPRAMRIARKSDFDRIYAQRCSTADGRLVVYAAANQLAQPRVGIPVSRRLGNAVRRNRIRRLLREAFRLEQHELAPGFDYLLIPRSGPTPARDEYRASLVLLAGRAVQKWRRRQPAADR